MKPFYFSDNRAIVKLAFGACDTPTKIISSKAFMRVFMKFYHHINRTDNELRVRLKPLTASDILSVYKLLLVWEFSDLGKLLPNAEIILSKQRALYRFGEQLYDYWRSLSRYGWILKRHLDDDEQEIITRTAESFNAAVLTLYRTITQRLLGKEFQFYRQLPAGVNANLVLTHNRWTTEKPYDKLQDTHFISRSLLRPPFILTTKSNTRSGLFHPISVNPLENIKFKSLDFLCAAVKVGPYLTYVYFHRDYIHHGVALASLFEPASISEYQDKKPDLIYVYGIQDSTYNATYYHDNKLDIYIGFVSLSDSNDYFGYMKKMLLTLHNVARINNQTLPIHGSMVTIELKNRKTWKVAIIGDSGAGKSETLEALRIIGTKYVRDIRVIFDDMGTFYIKNGQLFAQGTEIGAFIRLDDLEAGYAYKEMDRAIFMNPNKVNARIIMPVSNYDYIMKDHQLDMVLYANNYEDSADGLMIFNNIEAALETFSQGRRKAKGTTSETGLVTSYFANPFGPAQHKDKTDPILNSYFQTLFNQYIPVGQLFTRLGIPGYESSGPLHAAKVLLEYLINYKYK